METIRRDLDLLAEQGKVEGFLKNVGNANQLGGLLEDVRDAMIEYQVRIPPNYVSLQYLMFGSDFIATGYLRQQLSTHREYHFFSLLVRPLNMVGRNRRILPFSTGCITSPAPDTVLETGKDV